MTIGSDIRREQVQVHPNPVLVNLSRLPRDRKRRAWAVIREHRPGLAEALTDPAFQAIVEAFDGEVLVDKEDLPTPSEVSS